MPWQQYVADVALELLPDGTPAYREVGITVPRQSGKTTLVLSIAIDRAVLYNPRRPQTVLYTAQTGSDARQKLLEDMYDGVIAPSPLDKTISRVYRAKGEERIKFKTGSSIKLQASGEAAGHGKTIDIGFIDEAFADYDNRREGSMKPAMVTKRDAQIYWLSTAGTDESVFLLAKEALGRTAVEKDTGRGLAYFEWSADPDSDLDDESLWWEFMPALGHTIDIETIRDDKATMKRDEFARAYGNIWTRGKMTLIPSVLWESCLSDHARPSDGLVFGLEVRADRGAAAVVACDAAGAVELIEYRSGVDWVVGRVNELTGEYGAAVAVDSGGPASGFIDDLGSCVAVAGVDIPRACAAFYDAVVGESIQVRQSNVSPLTLAVSGVAKKDLDGRFVWSRRASSEDISPLMAATVGLWVARRGGGESAESQAEVFVL